MNLLNNLMLQYEREIIRELGEFEPKCEAKELNWSQFFDLENRSHCFKWIVLQLSPESPKALTNLETKVQNRTEHARHSYKDRKVRTDKIHG